MTSQTISKTAGEEPLPSQGENAADLSMHSASNHESTKYQKSFPTPKNTTPLGYHNRRKQMIKGQSPQPSFRGSGADDNCLGGLILGPSSKTNDNFDSLSRPKTRITVRENQDE